jgi:hypothetical protein
MQTSLFIARLLGPMFVVVGIALPLRQQMFRTILQELIRSGVLMYLAGFFGLLGGIALILTHNVWAADWRLIITLIGWFTLIRALITIFQPQWLVAAGAALLDRPRLFLGAAAVNLVIGLVLCYFGYVG